MNIGTITPRGIDVVEWCNQNNLNLSKFGSLPRVNNESEWQDWAAVLLNLPTIHGIVLPNPYQFTDWRRWASEFNLCMQSVQL